MTRLQAFLWRSVLGKHHMPNDKSYLELFLASSISMDIGRAGRSRYLCFHVSGSPFPRTCVEAIPCTEVQWKSETEQSIRASFGSAALACNLLSRSPILFVPNPQCYNIMPTNSDCFFLSACIYHVKDQGIDSRLKGWWLQRN